MELRHRVHVRVVFGRASSRPRVSQLDEGDGQETLPVADSAAHHFHFVAHTLEESHFQARVAPDQGFVVLDGQVLVQTPAADSVLEQAERVRCNIGVKVGFVVFVALIFLVVVVHFDRLSATALGELQPGRIVRLLHTVQRGCRRVLRADSLHFGERHGNQGHTHGSGAKLLQFYWPGLGTRTRRVVNRFDFVGLKM